MHSLHSMAMLLLFILSSSLFSIVQAESDLATFYLGFLSSTPDSAIPSPLAVQWQSAFEVALEVLNEERKEYRVEAVIEHVECDFQSAQAGAKNLLRQKNLIGVVGPACSEAAMSAARILQADGISLVSFAATAPQLSDRNIFSNFFRTVYSDAHQASALAAAITELQMTNITVVYTKDTYSTTLAQKIQVLCGGNVFRMQLLESGPNATMNKRELEGMFNSIEPYTFLILVLQPSLALKFWNLVTPLGKTAYPWWYLGSDGVTAIEPDMQGVVNGNLSGGSVEGELGLAPDEGDLSSNARCQKYYERWQAKSYPGLYSNKSSSYVPYVIDAVRSYFQVIDALQSAAVHVNSTSVLDSLSSSSSNSSFDGCTGHVRLDRNTGSRYVSVDHPPKYDVVSYASYLWTIKGKIVGGNFTGLEPLKRPGTFPADGQVFVEPIMQRSGKMKKENKALIAAIVVFSGAFVLVSITFICYHKIRQQQPTAFLKMHPPSSSTKL